MALGAVVYALFFHGVWEKKQAQQTVKRYPVKPPQLSQSEIPGSPYEIYPEKEPVVDVEKTPVKPLPPDTLPRIAIIIDDLGRDHRIAQKFLELPGPLTLSVLPHLAHSGQVADATLTKRWEVMVHLPMEPQEYPSINPGPGALLMTMDTGCVD